MASGNCVHSGHQLSTYWALNFSQWQFSDNEQWQLWEMYIQKASVILEIVQFDIITHDACTVCAHTHTHSACASAHTQYMCAHTHTHTHTHICTHLSSSFEATTPTPKKITCCWCKMFTSEISFRQLIEDTSHIFGLVCILMERIW